MINIFSSQKSSCAKKAKALADFDRLKAAIDAGADRLVKSMRSNGACLDDFKSSERNKFNA